MENILYVFVCMIMSSEEQKLTKERKIPVETYTKNKIHAICVYRKFPD